jgi:hypothetical protein
MDGRVFGTSKRLGWEGSFGKFENMLGRSYATFKSDTNRLYVQWKPADEGELLPPAEFERTFRGLERRLAIVGIETFERQWATRLDVSVDLVCAPEDGKALLDGLAAARLPRGQRLPSMGSRDRPSTSDLAPRMTSSLGPIAATSRRGAEFHSGRSAWRPCSGSSRENGGLTSASKEMSLLR